MIFENLSDKLQNAFKSLRGRGKLTEKDIDAAMREIKLALLDADVNFKVVKDFVKQVKERSIGSEVMDSLTPGQQVIKIVNDELTTLMGGTQSKISYASNYPTIIMLVGLQGAGKTTTIAKLGKQIKKEGHMPMAVAADVYRPAAIKQLQVVGEQAGITVYSEEGVQDPVGIVKRAVEKAKVLGNDVVLVDTAGRLHIDETLMQELKNIQLSVPIQEILLVVDAMTGQDAVNVAQSFNETLGIDGVILTKLDGDTRGGAALSIKAITQKPIKYAAVGEKLDALEPFYPDRMASRILGMGDVLTLIEKAQENFDQTKAKELEQKIRKQEFDFNDFLDQMQQIKKMGSLKSLLQMMPGIPKEIKDIDIDDKQMDRVQAIIYSMTLKERENPDILNASRRKRIAQGCGQDVREVNRLIKQFNESKKMMKQMTKMQYGGSKKGKKGRKMPFNMNNMKFPF
ncbi:MAG: signal recognition particle protein [Peptostreptococcaceae bacterium]|nr:signal recognition particle protein [Peptostreptococcaceae bacterium]